MMLSLGAIALGFYLLIKSADKFVEGAAALARLLGMSPLLVGMIIVGFGTSAPEMVVSAIAAMDGNPSLALGNAIGSNIVNISLILGVTALIAPIAVHSSIIRKELPILLLVTYVLGYMVWDFEVSHVEAWILLALFLGIVVWQIWSSLNNRNDALAEDVEADFDGNQMTMKTSLIWLLLGLIVLIASSRLLVWGAVNIAHQLGVSDLIIGLTIVALGTSLPELASSISAARKGEHDLAIGNIVGSNLFNTLAVVGIAGAIQPIVGIGQEIFWRDWATMLGVTMLLMIMTLRVRGMSRISPIEGAILLLSYVAYTGYLIFVSFA